MYDSTAKRQREGEAPAEPERQNSSGPLQLPSRKRPTHGVEVKQGQATIVFLTVCTENRQTWLASEPVHKLLREIWTDATAWVVGKYMLMPDHLHLFAGMQNDDISLDSWVKYWKSQFTKKHRNPEHGWQTDHWDTRMRTQEQYVEKLDYSLQNPVRRALVARASDWPYQGEIYELPW
jgi:putative transposase